MMGLATAAAAAQAGGTAHTLTEAFDAVRVGNHQAVMRLAVQHHPEILKMAEPPAFCGVSPLYAVACRTAWECLTPQGRAWAQATSERATAEQRRRAELDRQESVNRRLATLREAIGPAGDGWTLDRFDATTDQALAVAVTRAGQWVRRVTCGGWHNAQPRYTLTICGRQTGVGKTHLAVATARKLVEDTQLDATFARSESVSADIRAASQYVRETSVPAQARLTQLEQVAVLVLDELSLINAPGLVVDQLVSLVDNRQRAGLWTIVTTQAGSIDEIALPRGGDPSSEDAGRRLRSRLAAGVDIVMPSHLPDRRRAQPQGTP